ncbi:MAG: tripartite tricarboxylate transporter substrate-binding protein [Lachnospiraceae bacterium]|nr:tripartite tricarboxylate transporter substrate-binding protein [Lachnospiraceae bacterium]
MKKRILSMGVALGMMASMMVGMTAQAAETWTVTCPWAPSGVAAMVSQQAATKSTEYSDDLILVAEAVKGDAATVNTWVASNQAGDNSLVFAGEGLLSITSLLDPAKLQFDYENFAYVENLYSSIFVLSAEASLGLEGVEALEAYVESGEAISVAVNGATGSEAFLAAALFGAMGAGDQLKLVPYESAAEAAQAVAKGETTFAVSHQSQIQETYQQGDVTIVCAFDESALENGPFAGVEGVGEYGYPYFRNRCFVMAPAGTEEETVTALRTLYDDILADEEVTSWLQDTMLLEVDTMTEEDVKAHIENVKAIVEEYEEIVAG